ncbi:hypothetical protein DPMN_177426 [Dreissena polymorpha]|uniref:BEN domain-containing protein n=1 Tax=Dreissena polymorpha TaxID=45954 RepID=A0A9D4IJ02_DREPO|nr:hypothetical protein DPMN_177426 [Dreissena polymorpha]
MRHMMSWNGGGHQNKLALSPRRKSVIKQYVTAFHPKVASERSWQDSVVCKVNEALRRKEKRRESSPVPSHVPTNNSSEPQPHMFFGNEALMTPSIYYNM